MAFEKLITPLITPFKEILYRLFILECPVEIDVLISFTEVQINASGLIYMNLFYGTSGPLGGEMNAPIKKVFVRILTI